MIKWRKVVFPVAGLGSRFLPATKASPKEMMPVVDKPLIQYAVEEAVEAGATELVFITGRNKRSIEDHFDTAWEIEAELQARGKDELLASIRSIVPSGVSCIFIRQPAPLGLGHAVLCARPVVGNEPFAVVLADDLMQGDPGQPGILAQMAAVWNHRHQSLLAVQDVPRQNTRQYGIVSTTPDSERLERLQGIVEKPAPEQAPSTLAVVGRYVLTPAIFDLLATAKPGAGGEIQLTDAIARLLAHEPVLAYRYLGRRYDCGSKLGYMQAAVDFACVHPEIGKDFQTFLAQRKGAL